MQSSMPVVPEEGVEQESMDDEPSESIDDSLSDGTYTTSNRQESTFTRDD